MAQAIMDPEQVRRFAEELVAACHEVGFFSLVDHGIAQADIDAYFDLPINDRIRMHEQTLVNLRAEKREAEAKESAAIDAMLEENKPFDHTSPIDKEYSDFMRGIIERERKKIDDLERQILEEENWRGGHEAGAEDDLGGPRYDPMDE